MTDVIAAIKTRRSIRKFEKKDVSDELIMKILDAGRWAPSGNNNQPWRFVIVKENSVKENLAGLTYYGDIIKNAPVCISVFLDKNSMYDPKNRKAIFGPNQTKSDSGRTRDVQAIGACIQNILLAAHSLNLGCVWLGEILKNKEIVAGILKVPETYELMAVIAIGYPTEKERGSSRKQLKELIYESK